MAYIADSFDEQWCSIWEGYGGGTNPGGIWSNPEWIGYDATMCPDQLETPNPVNDLNMLIYGYDQRKTNGSKN